MGARVQNPSFWRWIPTMSFAEAIRERISMLKFSGHFLTLAVFPARPRSSTNRRKDSLQHELTWTPPAWWPQRSLEAEEFQALAELLLNHREDVAQQFAKSIAFAPSIDQVISLNSPAKWNPSELKSQIESLLFYGFDTYHNGDLRDEPTGDSELDACCLVSELSSLLAERVLACVQESISPKSSSAKVPAAFHPALYDPSPEAIALIEAWANWDRARYASEVAQAVAAPHQNSITA